ncbi:protein of unknown function [Nitrospira japonica]|uniref:Uncharacterized protein n=1 Tax=Nitrospira japonica TaxID=1325564 RepID=A0A1W1I337_9BACT|nr:protein of unknown function [Nitrospira japonica]
MVGSRLAVFATLRNLGELRLGPKEPFELSDTFTRTALVF